MTTVSRSLFGRSGSGVTLQNATPPPASSDSRRRLDAGPPLSRSTATWRSSVSPPQAARRFAETASSATRPNVICSARDGLCGDELSCGPGNGVCIDSCGGEQLVGLARPRHLAHREVLERELLAGERREHGLAEPA